jgi:hypothetical protein
MHEYGTWNDTGGKPKVLGDKPLPMPPISNTDPTQTALLSHPNRLSNGTTRQQCLNHWVQTLYRMYRKMRQLDGCKNAALQMAKRTY